MQRPSSPIHVIIADDRSSAFPAVRTLVETHPEVVVLAEVGSASELLGMLDVVRPDIVLAAIPSGGDPALDYLPLIRACHPKVPVVVLSAEGGRHAAGSAMAAGAAAHVTRILTGVELAAGVHVAAAAHLPARSLGLPAEQVATHE